MKKESFIISCVRRLREYGEGIIFADQAISTLLEVVKANVYTTLCLSQTSQKDRREVISVLGLSAQQAGKTNYLETGQGIVRLAGRYPLPQLLNFPFIKPRNISEKELDAINQKDERVTGLLSKVKTVNGRTCKQLPQDASDNIPEKTQDERIERAKDMLIDIANRFDVASTQRAKDFGLSGSSADKIFKYIEREQLVEVIKLNLSGARGGMSKYFTLTKQGYEAISKKPPKKSGGTGAMHYFLEKYMQKSLSEKGFTDLVIEKNIGGKRIDLFGKYDGLKVGIEICCSTIKTEFRNVRKDIDKCDVLIIVTPDKKTKEKLVKELFKKIKPDEKLKICVVHELLNDPEKIINKS
jgi:hypothetical protein